MSPGLIKSFHETWKLGDDGWTPLFTALRHTPSSSDHVVDGLRLLISLLQDNSISVPLESNFTNLENSLRGPQHNHGALSEGVLQSEEHLLAGGRPRLCPLDRRIILLLIYELCNNIEVSDFLPRGIDILSAQLTLASRGIAALVRQLRTILSLREQIWCKHSISIAKMNPCVHYSPLRNFERFTGQGR